MITVFIVAASGKIPKSEMILPYIIFSFFVILKTVIELIWNCNSELGCSLVFGKLLMKTLVLVTFGIGLKKIEDPSIRISWNILFIPLWIVVVVAFGGCLLGSIALLTFKIIDAMKSRKIFTTEVKFCVWAALNLLFLFFEGIFLLVKGASFGEGQFSIKVFILPAVIGLVFSIGMTVWLSLNHSKLQ